MTTISAEALRDLAPSGVIRAGINFGNAALARGPVDRPTGISIDLSRELARRVGAEVSFVPYMTAGALFEAIGKDKWDVAFMAVDKARMDVAAFTAPYMSIESVYLVRREASLQTLADVDREGIRIASQAGAAYTTFLERNLKAAKVVAVADAIEAFRIQGLDAAAGIRQQISEYARLHGDVRELSTPFMEIAQAMAVPRAKVAGAHYLRGFIEEMRASAFVGQKLG